MWNISTCESGFGISSAQVKGTPCEFGKDATVCRGPATNWVVVAVRLVADICGGIWIVLLVLADELQVQQRTREIQATETLKNSKEKRITAYLTRTVPIRDSLES